MVHEQVAGAHGGEHVRAAVVALQARLRHRRPRRVAQLLEPGQVHDLPQVAEVEQALDVEDLVRLDAEALDELVAQAGVHARADLHPYDLAEAAPAQLVLDRLQQVVGLVGDGEVGVAGDLEVVVVEDLHPREQRVEVGRDDLLHGHEGQALPHRHEAGQHLLRHLHAGEGLVAGDRVAHEHRQREREVGDVRERAPQADGQRREHGEDLAPEARVELAPLVVGDVVDRGDADAGVAQAGHELVLEAADLAPAELAHARLDRVHRLARRHAVGPAGVDAGLELVVQAGDPDHEELVQVRGVDRAELHALEQGHRGVLDQLQDAVVEVQPRHLAVEVQARVGERDRRLGFELVDGVGIGIGRDARHAGTPDDTCPSFVGWIGLFLCFTGFRPLVQGAFELRAEVVALEALPAVQEALEQEHAPGLEPHRQHLEAAVGVGVRDRRAQRRRQIVLVGGQLDEAVDVRVAQLADGGAHQREHLVAVVDLPQQVLELLGPLQRGPRVGPEAERGDLEHVAQPLGGDAHVVQGLDLLGVQRLGREGVELVEAGADDPLGVGGEARGRVKALDPARLHAARSPHQFAQAALEVVLLRAAKRLGKAHVGLGLLGPEAVGEQRHARAARRLDAGGEAIEGGDVDVGVTALAQRVGQRLDVAQHAAVQALGEARGEDLEHGAQAARGHAHVVDALDVGRVEHVVGVVGQLLGAHRDDLRRGVARRTRRR